MTGTQLLRTCGEVPLYRSYEGAAITNFQLVFLVLCETAHQKTEYKAGLAGAAAAVGALRRRTGRRNDGSAATPNVCGGTAIQEL